jgi:hypothetical protein
MAGSFEGAQVTGEVAVGEPENILQVTELGPVDLA